MKNAHMPGAPVGETVIDFLRGAVEKYGSRDALLFKPAFRYQRWSYSRLWNESGQVATLLQRRGLTMGDQVILWGPQAVWRKAGLHRVGRGCAGPGPGTQVGVAGSDRGALVLRDDRWRIRHGSGLRCLARAPNPITHLWGQWADTVLRGVT